MEKLAKFLVRRRYLVVSVFIALTVIFSCLIPMVRVNHDMTKYLPDDSTMKIGMDIMEEEFGMLEASVLRIMFSGLTKEEETGIAEWLASREYVGSVDYAADSEEYHKNSYTLYNVNVPYDNYSAEAASVYQAVNEQYAKDYEIAFSGDIATANNPDLPLWIMILAVSLLMIILFALCKSWIEPILFLTAIGMAILINMGSNAFLDSISEQTYSMAAIMQLVLSMDYSIILFNRYRQEKSDGAPPKEAMERALAKSFAAITSSSVTTFVGLLALVFMSFKIGMDFGIVLAKSVAISLVCIFTVLPALTLQFDGLVERLQKKTLTFRLEPLGRWSDRFRFVFLAAFVIIFAGSYILKGNTEIEYTLKREDIVEDIFLPDNSIVLLYHLSDDDAVRELIAQWEETPDVKSVMGYANTLGMELTVNELAGSMQDSGMELEESLVSLLYYMYYEGTQAGKETVSDLVRFVKEELLDSSLLAGQLDEEMKEQIRLFITCVDEKEAVKPRSAEELAEVFPVSAVLVNLLYSMAGTEEMSIQQFLGLMDRMMQEPAIAGLMDETQQAQLTMMHKLVDLSVEGSAVAAEELAVLLRDVSDELDAGIVELLYLFYESSVHADPEWTMNISELFRFLTEEIVDDERFAPYLDEEIKEDLAAMKQQMDEGAAQLAGETYGRVIVNVSLPEDSLETRAFIRSMTDACKSCLSEDFYLIGNSVMAYQMSETFGEEVNRITWLTAALIFAVVMITFRSVVIPLILVLLIQCGVYATMGVISLMGDGVFYLALLIVQSILMGATIDYAILFTSYYRELRGVRQTKSTADPANGMSRSDALIGAYNGSIHTILTSALIMILVTGILAEVFANPTVGAICHTISLGALCATLLILFILPGVLAAADRFVIRKK